MFVVFCNKRLRVQLCPKINNTQREKLAAKKRVQNGGKKEGKLREGGKIESEKLGADTGWSGG